MIGPSVNAAPDRQLDDFDFNPYELLKDFRFPNSIEHDGTTYWFPTVLPSGHIYAICDNVSPTLGMNVIFSPHEIEIDDRPLMELAREAREFRNRVAGCCHSASPSNP